MNKQEIHNKIETLRRQGNQTDVSGSLADLLTELFKATDKKVLTTKPFSQATGSKSRAEFKEALGITEEQLDSLLRGEVDALKCEETEVEVYLSSYRHITSTYAFEIGYGGIAASRAGVEVAIVVSTNTNTYNLYLNEV